MLYSQENNNTKYTNPELDMISKDIEELAREKLALETDIAQKEADIKIKSGEIKSLQVMIILFTFFHHIVIIFFQERVRYVSSHIKAIGEPKRGSTEETE